MGRLIIALLLCVPSLASAEQKHRGVSCGSAARGKLHNGMRLRPQGLGYLIPVNWRKRGTNYGAANMVRLLRTTADALAKEYPGTVLVIGDVSVKNGGKLWNHRSHQTGRDVDIGYLRMDKNGKALGPINRFVGFHRSGKAKNGQGYFDLKRNWALVKMFLTNDVAPAQMIFVSQQIRLWLLTYAAAIGESEKLRIRAANVLRRQSGHNDHLHLRIQCSSRDVELGNCGWKKKCVLSQAVTGEKSQKKR